MGKLSKNGSSQSGDGKVKAFFRQFGTYWNKPPEGRYLSYKEAAAYCVGGMGVFGATVLPQYITLTGGLYYAAALNIRVSDILIISIITSLITILRAPLYTFLIDNTNSKYGKFRPYLIWMPIPIVISFFLIGWIPSLIGSYVWMLVAFTILFNLMQFFMGLYSLAFSTLLQVITPKQTEKEMLMGVGSVIYSCGSTVVSTIFPLMANMMFIGKILSSTGEVIDVSGINTIGPYRWLLPITLVICLAIGYWTAFGTKERIITSKKYKQKVSLMKGLRATGKNKYFWLSTLSGLLGTVKLFTTSYTYWICYYILKNDFAQSIMVNVIGFAYLPGMLLAPLFINKIGKKKLVILSNALILLFTIPMIFVATDIPGSAYWLFAFNFLIVVANSVQVVTGPALQTQVFDYQQLKTGDRMEGAITQSGGILNTAVGIGTAFILPAIYNKFGYQDDTSVLYNLSEVTYPIMQTSFIISAVAAALSIIPMFFWDMTEKKHMQIIEVLKVRAAKDDNEIDVETAESLEHTIFEGDMDAFKNYIKEKEETDPAPVPEESPQPES